MKILFLDNDGVICLAENWGTRFKKARKHMIADNISEHEFADERKRNVLFRFDNFDKKAVKILNEILEETGAEIVVSSDWKLHANLEELGEYYESQGIIKKPIAMTRNLEEFDESTNALFTWKGWKGKTRILEIRKYLEEHSEVTHWVAIDDLNMSPECNQGSGLENFVLTPRSTEGIKQSGIKDKLLKFLQ